MPILLITLSAQGGQVICHRLLNFTIGMFVKSAVMFDMDDVLLH